MVDFGIVVTIIRMSLVRTTGNIMHGVAFRRYSKKQGVSVLCVLALIWFLVGGEKSANVKPTISRYMSFLDKSDYYAQSLRLGCDAGKVGAGGVVVLAYGKQVGGGTRAFGAASEYYDYNHLMRATLAYSEGLRTCSRGNLSWTIVVTTSNYKFTKHTPGDLWGKEWAYMINSLSNYNSDTIKYYGGTDIEPSWGERSSTLSWLKGYREISRSPLWSNASADGCPVNGYGSCANGWNVKSLGDAVWADNGVAVPQIYRIDGVQGAQWGNIAKVYHESGKIPLFGAVMTQSRACFKSSNRNCPTLSNSPQDALRQVNRHISKLNVSVLEATDIGWE